ncbi:MAG TPA: hypothetical protein VEK79_22190 [Thermoanaerobaculia bacterium]|nr:hypothetical protein [Thermoanaerobaculia bacterium]
MALPPTNTGPARATGIARAQMPAIIIGVIGIIGAAIGLFTDAQEFYRAWLPAFVFWFLIASGALGVLMLQYVTGGEWGVLIRRPLGAAARTIPLFILFGLPIAFGLKHIYIWADPAIVHGDHLLEQKSLWLNPMGWIIRSLIYIGLLSLWAWRVRVLSLKFYEDRSPFTELKRRKWSAFGLVIFVMSLTLSGVDWVMSLEPKWYSSMFGISFTIGAGLSAFAFVTFFLTLLSENNAMKGILKASHFRDLGNLMLAFTMLWAYTNFSQFMLIWYGNIKEETPYYLKRMHGGWGVMAAVLIVFHFFLPFTMLLMRAIKDRPRTIAIVTVIILVMRFVDIYWLTVPAHHPDHFYLSWITLFAFLGIGGLWLAAFIWQLKGQTIIPIHETWVDEAIREGALQREAHHA